MQKIVLYGALIGVISLSAQDTGRAVASEMIASTTPVKGAPYSAHAVNETVQVLGDGNRITRSNSTMVYRDSLGRERRERASSGNNPAVGSISITDPVEGVGYDLNPKIQIAIKSDEFFAAGGAGGSAVGSGTEYIVPANGVVSVSDGVVTLSEGSRDAKVEKLGTQMIEGVLAEGTRKTITLLAGAIGNEQPIVTITERWYSPELKVLVMSIRSDPRTGTTTYKLTNINRSEPAAALFQVPLGYKVTDATRLRADPAAANKNEQ